MDDDDLEFKFYGYITLAMKPLDIPKKTSKTQLKKKKSSIPQIDDDYIISCFLIGQLAKNDLYEDKITGKEIMELAYMKIIEAQELVGGRVILLDVYKFHNSVIRFYENEGFKKVQMISEDQEYIQMVKYI